MYEIYLEWEAKSPSEWMRLAQEAEKEGRRDDAAYCWASFCEATRGDKKKYTKMKKMMKKCLKVICFSI